MNRFAHICLTAFAGVTITFTAFGLNAAAQVSGSLDWSTLGIADENVVPDGTTSTSVGVTTTVNWTTVTDGGTFVAYAGNDFVSYESGAQGGFTGYAQLGFDNSREDPDDQVIVDITFSEAITELQFTITDIDQSSWDDFVEVYYNTGAGLINAKTGAFETMGPVVFRDNESFGDGWEGGGSAASSSTDGNLAFDFGTLQITAIQIVYFSSNDASGNNPGAQQLGISDISYDKLLPNLSVVKTVSVYDPGAAGLFSVPGNDIVYTITVTNSGDGTVDTDSTFLIDDLPGEIEFYNGDIDDAGPETGAIAFSQSGAGLTFTEAADVAYSSSGTAPANFAACSYSPSIGYDPAVTYICFNPKGAMQAGAPDPTFSVSFRARIE